MTSLAAVLLQATRADFGRMVRGDALSLALGLFLIAVALAAAAVFAGFLRKESSLGWFALFTLAYGVRLLAQTGTVRLLFDAPPLLWDHLISAITYPIGLSVILFLRAMFPTWRHSLNRTATFLGAFAVLALAADFVLGRPYAALTANNLIIIGFMLVSMGLLFRPGLTPSHELTTLRVGLVSFGLAAVVDNLRGLGVGALPVQSVEPVGFAVLIACLAMVVARRLFENFHRLLSLEKELSIARRIQEALLPLATPQLSGLTIAARYRPMAEVAGDFYDFLEVDDRRLGILVADVSGHGVPAALIASMVKIAFAAQKPQADRPAAVLTGMHEALSGHLGGQYVTAAYLFLDREAGLMRYGAAGHPPLLRWSARQRLMQQLEENGLPLGLLEGVRYGQMERPVEPGERFVLYTDGLVEAANAGGEYFGVDRVNAAVAAGAELSADALASRLLDEMSAWTGSIAGDDLTLVVVDCA